MKSKMQEEKEKEKRMRYNWPENRLKGSLTECIVEQMFSQAGYHIFRFGYESAIQHLKEMKLKDSPTSNMIRAAPDFIIASKEEEVYFLEVKYRTNGKLYMHDIQKLKTLAKYWPQAVFLLISNKEPFFQVQLIRNFIEDEKLYPLGEVSFIKIEKNIIEEYTELIRKYLRRE